MNRKQRRAAGPSGARPAVGAAVLAGGARAELFAAAVTQHQAGALADAERRYRYILALYPDHADSLHNLGLIALHNGDAASAVDLIDKALKLNRVAEYHYNIALAWRGLGRMDKVAVHLEQAVALRSDHALAHLNLGNVRTEQGRLADAAACYQRALALIPNSAAAHFNLANVLSQQGRWQDAIASYRQALTLEPNHAEAHHRLAAALIAVKSAEQAIGHFEAALALKPDLPGGFRDLGALYLSVGKPDAALHAAARAVELQETPQARTLFGRCAGAVRFTANDERMRHLLLRALSEAWGRPRALTGTCISLITLNPTVADWIARADAAWPARLSPDELLGSSLPATLAADRLLIGLLKCDPVTDIGLERLLANVRHALLQNALSQKASLQSAEASAADGLLELSCALANQCFINEYVFSQTDTETSVALQLHGALEAALAAQAPLPSLWPAIAGAYWPLHKLDNAHSFLTRQWPPPVDALIVQQVKEPAQERELASTIPALTEIDSEVSRLVRQQYEESPYPRWAAIGASERIAMLPLPQHGPKQILDVLAAGCGTGLSVIEFAREARHVRILAVDLSLASLGYAKRMAQSLGVSNIEFAQADINKLGSIGRDFDFIDVSGVLHHLEDPWAGWRVLLSLLRPGGLMQVGLYSALARQNVVAGRALIAERGYQPSPEDIRRCRQAIMAADDGSLLKSLTRIDDFFSASDCRDMLFHVQEHHITLPEIKSFLAENNFQFTGFNLDQAVLRRFAARFPEPSALFDLDCWHRFEVETPSIFLGMYQFWVRKPDETTENGG